MKCPKCGNEEVTIIKEKKPLTAGGIILTVLFFPISLLFLLVREDKTVFICNKCGSKFELGE